MDVFLFVLAYALVISWISLRRNWKTESKKTFWVSAGFVTVTFIILTLTSFNIYPPSPLIAVQRLVNMIFHIE